MLKNNFVTKFMIFLFGVQLLTGFADASATYSSSSNEIAVWYEPSANFTWLYKALNNDSILSHEGDIWYLHAKIRLYGNGTTFYINNSDVSELRINSTSNAVYLYKGSFKIENVTIGTWDYKTKSYSFSNGLASAEFSNPKLKNVNFKSFGRVLTYGVDGEIYNLTMKDGGSSALVLIDFNNSSVHDVSISNYTGGGLNLQKCFNTEVYNIRVEDVADFQNPATGYYGIVAYYDGATHTYCDNITIHDCYVNGTGWSGVDTCSNRTTFYNLTIRNAGHNGLDIHGGHNHTAYNISIYDSVSNNLYALMPDCHFENINLYDCVGDQIFVSINAKNNTFKNISMINGSRGIVIYGSNDCDFVNITKVNGGRSVVFAQSSDALYIPSNINFRNADLSSGELYFEKSKNIKFVNVNYGAYGRGSTPPNERAFYYYPDIMILDSNKNPCENSSIQFTNEINTKYLCLDANDNERNLFITEPNGKLSSPLKNSLNSPAIVESYRNFTEYVKFSHIATITTLDNRTVSLSGITPDSSWYRKDPNIPTYTITAIIPNASSKGPDIIGFAPSRENPFNPGEKKNFRVWTDEPLTSMEWLVNGSSVLKGSLNYTWTVTDRNTTIEFIGSNANGPVNHKWDLGESSNETSGNDSIDDEIPEQEVIFSPADSMITLNVSEKTVFSFSPDVFTTKEWYINGYPIQNNTTSMTRCWSTAGTHNVTFRGAGSGEPVSYTWTVNVVEEERNDEETTESIIAITPEYQIVKPKQSFGLDINVDPSTSIIGTQIDFAFNSSMASANSVTEGDLFKQKGASTFFNEGDINSSEGTIKHIYGLIIGTSNVSSSGTFATVNLTAGNRTGIAKFSLSNVLISDINSKSVPYTVTNATVLIDTAPAIDPICCPKSVDEKSNLAFKISAKDADGDRLTLSASGLPEGASFNRTSGAFAWTPAVGQTGVYTIAFKVSDGYLTDSENVTVTVNKLNNPPVIDFFEPINGSSFSEGERIGISVNATDAEKQALNYSIKIDGVMYSSDPAYIWETDYSSSGNHTIEVSVSDGIDEAKMQHSIYISECHPRYDVNEDGVVNILDITNVSIKYETTVSKPYPRYDINQDGEINILDLTLVGQHLGEKIE